MSGLVTTLSDGARVVTFEEVQEQRPSKPVPTDVLPTADGTPIQYERTDVFEELTVAGRIKTKVEADTLEYWRENRTALTYVERDDTLSTGWRIKRDAPPAPQRKDGDSADWTVTVKLWRAG